MSPAAVTRIRANWALVAGAPEDLAAVFYARLFTTHPQLRALFAHADMAAQGVKLAATLGLVVRGLDDLPRLTPAVEHLGRTHAGYGVREEHFAAVGDALLWTLAVLTGDAFDAPTRAAWAAAYGALADVMCRATRGAPPAVAAAA